MKKYIILVAAIITGLVFYGPITQDPAYHNFADKRNLCGVEYMGDVISNLAFLMVGVWGLLRSRSCCHFKCCYCWFFIGVILTSAGSAYYHLAPDNATLIWDRLPMTIAFMSLLTLIIAEQLRPDLAGKLLFPLLLLGISSVYYWYATSDLRPYILVQFLPIITIPILLFTQPARPQLRCNFILLVALYGVSKVLEQLDYEVYNLTGEMVSGHTLKHLAAACAIVFVVRSIPTNTKETS